VDHAGPAAAGTQLLGIGQVVDNLASFEVLGQVDAVEVHGERRGRQFDAECHDGLVPRRIALQAFDPALRRNRVMNRTSRRRGHDGILRERNGCRPR
jgi:hypothetical protein